MAAGIAAAGARVAVADLDQAGAQAVAGKITGEGGQAVAYGVDVTDRESVGRLAAAVIRDLGPIDGLVNGAGITRRGAAESFPLATSAPMCGRNWGRASSTSRTGGCGSWMPPASKS